MKIIGKPKNCEKEQLKLKNWLQRTEKYLKQKICLKNQKIVKKNG